MTAVEGMACGTPAVVSGGPRYEAVVVGANALVVPRGDAAALAKAMARTLVDGDLAELLRQRPKRSVYGLESSAVARRYGGLMLRLAGRGDTG